MNAYTLAAIPPVLLAIAEPVLFVPIVAVVALIAVTLAGLRFRDQRDTAREAAERAGRERDAAETEARIATELLAQREAERRRARLCAVPTQRDGSEYEWPRIARAISIDEIGHKADWCEDDGSFAICGTRMTEHSRTSEGVKWCFHCRKRHEFWFVVTVPDGLSYYGPSYSIDGPTPDCTDLFPGWSREWEED